MRIAYKYESDGICFARQHNACKVMCELHPRCGTYYCPFYKPVGCEEWLRIDKSTFVRMYTPDEFEVREWGGTGAEDKQQG